MKKQRKLFCEYGPLAYNISICKEALKKDIEDTAKMCYYSIMPTGATSLPPLSKWWVSKLKHELATKQQSNQLERKHQYVEIFKGRYFTHGR